MIIRGFSHRTGYNCGKCRSVCCTTEYDLPLCGTEESSIFQEYPRFNFLLQKTSRGSKILRGDSCPFFSHLGDCSLHKTSFKPIACQIYPLIFWKFNQKDILVWINPCRGNGFQWNSIENHRIEDSNLKNLLTISDKYFDNYFGEEIDQNNPFAKITEKRIVEQWDIFRFVKEEELLKKMVERVNISPYSSICNSSELSPYVEKTNHDLINSINAVLKWIMWSPVGLSLSLVNLQIISTVAAQWILRSTLEPSDSDQNLFKNSHYIQQVSSFYATSILPSYWFNMYQHTGSKELRSFAKRVQLILIGQIPQQKLHSFNQF